MTSPKLTRALSDRRPCAPCPTRFNMAQYVLAQAESCPAKPALEIVHTGGVEVWSYGQLAAAVRGTAAGFLHRGLRPGQRVLMRLGNCVDFPITYLAAIAVGIVPVPTSAQLTATEITAIAAHVDAAVIVVAPGVALHANCSAPVVGLADLADMRKLPAADYLMGDPDRPAYIIFTSGTSGKPRAVVHAHRAVWARRMMRDGWTGLQAEDRLLHAGAFNWTYTLGVGLIDPWSVGATAVIAGSGVKLDGLAPLIAQHEVSIFAAAPGVFRRLLRQDMGAARSLRHGLSAGEKLDQTTATAWQDATGTPIYEAFGMSECSTFISASPGRAAPAGTIGFAQDGRRVAIVEDGTVCATGAPGEIAVGGDDPGLMLGYLDDPNVAADDWFLTGDSGQMDVDGAITYLGRRDDMLNAGGFRVSPVEVETAMALCRQIDECAAVEMPVKDAVAVIGLYYTSAHPLDAQVLSGHAAAHLARFKQPRIFRRIDALPVGPNGKLRRAALRKLAKATT